MSTNLRIIFNYILTERYIHFMMMLLSANDYHLLTNWEGYIDV